MVIMESAGAPERRWAALMLAWLFSGAWVGAVALQFRSVPRPPRPSFGPLIVLFTIVAVSAVAAAVSVHLRPSTWRVVALATGLVISLGWTWRDLRWLQGAGREDGQNGLVWLDPTVVLLIVYPCVLAAGAVASRGLSRIRGR